MMSIPSPLARSARSPTSSSNTNNAAFSPFFTAAATNVSTSRDFPVPAGPGSARSIHAPDHPRQRVQFGDLGRDLVALEAGPVLGRDQARKYAGAASFDDEVVIAAAKASPAIFGDPDPPALRTEFSCELLGQTTPCATL